MVKMISVLFWKLIFSMINRSERMKKLLKIIKKDKMDLGGITPKHFKSMKELLKLEIKSLSLDSVTSILEDKECKSTMKKLKNIFKAFKKA